MRCLMFDSLYKFHFKSIHIPRQTSLVKVSDPCNTIFNYRAANCWDWLEAALAFRPLPLCTPMPRTGQHCRGRASSYKTTIVTPNIKSGPNPSNFPKGKKVCLEFFSWFLDLLVNREWSWTVVKRACLEPAQPAESKKRLPAVGSPHPPWSPPTAAAGMGKQRARSRRAQLQAGRARYFHVFSFSQIGHFSRSLLPKQKIVDFPFHLQTGQFPSLPFSPPQIRHLLHKPAWGIPSERFSGFQSALFFSPPG